MIIKKVFEMENIKNSDFISHATCFNMGSIIPSDHDSFYPAKGLPQKSCDFPEISLFVENLENQ